MPNCVIWLNIVVQYVSEWQRKIILNGTKNGALCLGIFNCLKQKLVYFGSE